MTLENTLDLPLREDVAQLFSSASAPERSAALEAQTTTVARELANAWAGELFSKGARVGPYEVEEVLGRGGQGTVYKARDDAGRLHALKIPRPELVSRLVREAQILFHLDHPRVLRIEKAVVDNEVPFIATEYLEAGSLSDRLSEAGGRLEEPEVRAMAADILEALAYAHEKGVVHRDLKPSNILFGDDGRVKVADFGIGSLRLVERVGVAGTLVSGDRTVLAGTPLYMAPEQEHAGEPIDGRADLYALGKVLYQALTGRSPRTVQPVSQIVPGLSPGWDAFLFRLLEDAPEDRVGSAQEAQGLLEHLEHVQPPPTATQAEWRPGVGSFVRPSQTTVQELAAAFERLGYQGRGTVVALVKDVLPPYPRWEFGVGVPVTAGGVLDALSAENAWSGGILLVQGDRLIGACNLVAEGAPEGAPGPGDLSLILDAVVLVVDPRTGQVRIGEAPQGSRPQVSRPFHPRRLVERLSREGLVATWPTLPREESRAPTAWVAAAALLVGLCVGLAPTLISGPGGAVPYFLAVGGLFAAALVGVVCARWLAS